jgi:hypothetical protein
VPAAERRRPAPARRLRCEGCLEVLSLRHAWDVRACGCGALLLSGRPSKPTVHWLSRPGGGWTELADGPDAGPDVGAQAETVGDRGEEGDDAAPGRRLGYYSRPRMAVPVEEIQPPVALTQASLASGT